MLLCNVVMTVSLTAAAVKVSQNIKIQTIKDHVHEINTFIFKVEFQFIINLFDLQRKTMGAAGGPKISSLTTALITVSMTYLLLSLPGMFVQLFYSDEYVFTI